jgi:murein DD-endopeptidase MepM/ murein hydrolase activator NlpD
LHVKTLIQRQTPHDLRGWSSPSKPLRPVLGRRFVALMVMVVLGGGLFVSTPPPRVSADDLSDAYAKQQQLQKQVAAQKREIASLSASQASLSKKLSNTKATLSSVIADLNEVRVEIVSMTVDVAKAQSSVDELESTVAQADQQLAAVEDQEQAKGEELQARKKMLAERIRTAYDTDRQSLLETFLSSEDFTDVLTEVGYHLDFASQDKSLAEQIVADQKTLAVLHETTRLTRESADQMRDAATAQKAKLDGEMKDLADAKAHLAALEEQTRRLIAEQQAAMARILADKQQAAALLSKAQKSEKALESLINRLVLQALQSGGIPSQYSGSLMWPMPGVVTQPFGCTGFGMEPPLGSCAHFHRGIDIANSSGTPIRAAGSGKVIYAGLSPYDPAYIVVIAHSSHLVSWYGHIQTHIPVHVGQYVGKGQVIAYEGCTGWCTGPHLHWATQLDDTWVNPRIFL